MEIFKQKRKKTWTDERLKVWVEDDGITNPELAIPFRSQLVQDILL